MNIKSKNSILFFDILEASGFSENEILLRCRKHNIVNKRAIICCIMRDMGVSITDISVYVGIDRSTIYNLLKKEVELESEISNIKEKIWQKRNGGKLS